jgi:hypothetical protein
MVGRRRQAHKASLLMHASAVVHRFPAHISDGLFAGPCFLSFSPTVDVDLTFLTCFSVVSTSDLRNDTAARISLEISS